MVQPLKDIQVLLVEDEPDMVVLLTYLLEDKGAAVTVTTTALEALQVLNEQHPQILVCNLRLPDLDGRQLLKQVRQAPATDVRQLPAIAVTSYSREYTTAMAQLHDLQSVPILVLDDDPDSLALLTFRLRTEARLSAL